MKETLIYWAQALDNTSPDHIKMYGQDLSPDDTARRQEVVSLISKVVKVGSRIFDKRGVQLTYDGYSFVIEVPTVERDRAGRIAPIVCFGDYDLKVSDALGASVAVGLDLFAKRINRNILPEHIELMQTSFSDLKKKSSKKMFVRGVVKGIVFLVLLSLAYWLVTIGSTKM